MAETAWTVQDLTQTGIAPTKQAIDVTNSNKFANNGRVRLHFYGAASAVGTVTVKGQVACEQGVVHDKVTAANALDATTKELELGPFDMRHFNDSTGNVIVQFTGVMTGVTCSVIREV